MERLNIYHRKDGCWEGRISHGKKDNGQRKFRYIFGKSKEQVRNKMKEILMSEASGTCCKTVQELFNEWLCSAKHRVKESTLANYRLKADNHILPVFGSQKVSSISSNDIYAFIDNKQSSGLSNRYIIDIHIVMKSVFKHAVRTYHIINPMDGITMPKKGTSEIRVLESDEQHQLEQYISDNRNNTTMGIALTMNSNRELKNSVEERKRENELKLEQRLLQMTLRGCHNENNGRICVAFVQSTVMLRQKK